MCGGDLSSCRDGGGDGLLCMSMCVCQGLSAKACLHFMSVCCTCMPGVSVCKDECEMSVRVCQCVR